MAFDAKAYKKQWALDNAERVKKQRQQHYLENRERIRFTQSRRERTPEERRQEWLNVKMAQNTQVLLEMRIAKVRARGRDVVREDCPAVTTEEFATLEWVCQNCGGYAEQVNHILPITKGGCSALHNLQWLCVPCNRRKANKYMSQWLREDEYWAWAERTRSAGCPHFDPSDLAISYFVADAHVDWKKKNPDRRRELSRASESRRRSRKRGAVCLEAAIGEIDGLVRSCQVCGNEKDLELDHVVPVARGGCSALHNLQWLCTKCNSRKRSKLMCDWLSEGEFMAWAERTHSGGCTHARVI